MSTGVNVQSVAGSHWATVGMFILSLNNVVCLEVAEVETDIVVPVPFEDCFSGENKFFRIFPVHLRIFF